MIIYSNLRRNSKLIVQLPHLPPLLCAKRETFLVGLNSRPKLYSSFAFASFVWPFECKGSWESRWSLLM